MPGRSLAIRLLGVALLAVTLSQEAISRNRYSRSTARPSNPEAESQYLSARKRYYDLINSRQAGEATEGQICIENFRSIASKYPSYRRASEAWFTIGLLYWNMHQRFGKRDSLYKAIDAYTTLINSYPNEPLADDAMYNTAIISEEN